MMGSQELFFDLPSFARKHLGGCIENLHLTEGKLNGGGMTLSNNHCHIFLYNQEDTVGFDFAAQNTPLRKFDLRTFLDAIIEGGSANHFPAWPRNMAREDKFRGCLDAFKKLLETGAMKAPLSGDFSWQSKYDEFAAEENRLVLALAKLPRSMVAETIPIYRKQLASDLTWMDDVRRILAEQESKS
jgi:hypothetical protein